MLSTLLIPRPDNRTELWQLVEAGIIIPGATPIIKLEGRIEVMPEALAPLTLTSMMAVRHGEPTALPNGTCEASRFNARITTRPSRSKQQIIVATHDQAATLQELWAWFDELLSGKHAVQEF